MRSQYPFQRFGKHRRSLENFFGCLGKPVPICHENGPECSEEASMDPRARKVSHGIFEALTRLRTALHQGRS